LHFPQHNCHQTVYPQIISLWNLSLSWHLLWRYRYCDTIMSNTRANISDEPAAGFSEMLVLLIYNTIQHHIPKSYCLYSCVWQLFTTKETHYCVFTQVPV
jgi:hypothetical protein